jgi:predicted RNA-binding protein associated with RNAse of E/G family
MFFPPDADHSVWWFFDDAGVFTGWYVNLEERSVRWDDGAVAGVDVVDQDLDVVVAPDRTWQWKDEDEFTERLGFPEHYWVTDEQAVRNEGLRVIKQVESGDFPFDGQWTDFVPDPQWQVPDLPAGWDRPPATRI